MPGGTGKVSPFTDSCRKMGANYAETQGGKDVGMGGRYSGFSINNDIFTYEIKISYYQN